MTQNEDDQHNKIVGVLLVSLVSLACALTIGVGVSRLGDKPAPVTSVVALPEPAQALDTVTQPLVLKDDESAVRVVDGVVKFYFASGSAQLAEGADEALQSVVQAGLAGKTLKISGFHDSTGSPQANAVLAAQRAQAVHAALARMGVPDAAMELVKPENIPTTEGALAEARRVEVAIQ